MIVCMCLTLQSAFNSYKQSNKIVSIDGKEGDTIIRFKDAATCVQILKNYATTRRFIYVYVCVCLLPSKCACVSRIHLCTTRRLIKRAIYAQVEVSNLNITKTTYWVVTSCRPKFRRDQIAKGLSSLTGVSILASRQLAARIPASKYPATIQDVKNYCCKNVCIECNGARLYGDVQVSEYMHMCVHVCMTA